MQLHSFHQCINTHNVLFIPLKEKFTFLQYVTAVFCFAYSSDNRSKSRKHILGQKICNRETADKCLVLMHNKL
jgi:hypothetical protein